jgi:hypothetical protein
MIMVSIIKIVLGRFLHVVSTLIILVSIIII